MKTQGEGQRLADKTVLGVDALAGNAAAALGPAGLAASSILVVLAAGKGTRFGVVPKCVQPVGGVPLARHSIDAFRRVVPESPCICLVGYAGTEVMARLGDDPYYVQTADPAGGTAMAAYESLSVPGLLEHDSLLVVTMGDRMVPDAVFQRLLDVHRRGEREADLTMLTAYYVPPAQHGRGRILRDQAGRIERIVEQRDIDALTDPGERCRLDELVEGNCPLYVLRARLLHRLLGNIRNDNAQGQYYLTDAIETLALEGGDIRTLSTCNTDPEYMLLCSDVTRPADLARLESLLGAVDETPAGTIAAAAGMILADRSPGQTAAIASQLREAMAIAQRDGVGFRADRSVAIGISGGRFRIAFMHPDMGRFYGPAWQMPTGAADETGREQIVLLAQQAEDGHIHHVPSQAEFDEKISSVPADDPGMYPAADIDDVYKFEEFGTRMAEQVLLSLGYFSAAEIRARQAAGLPLPPHSLWVGNSMRRPFSLICNAIASLRTLRAGATGERVQRALGREDFRGLRVVTTGNIPRGGFSSSSALTVAVKNALNVLYRLGIPADTLVHLACQAEYGTGVRAGSLDQATEQKGKHGQGALISSNPRENYRIIGVYPVPTERIRFLFPFSVDRDREAWKWSGGTYAAAPDSPLPTPLEIRKLTGKAAEIAAVLCRLPLQADFFMMIEEDLVRDGMLGESALHAVYGILRQLPLRIRRQALRDRVVERRESWAGQLVSQQGVPPSEAMSRVDSVIESLFAGWREPLLLRGGGADGGVAAEPGIPLRAIIAYLFVEVARNIRLLHDPENWIETVTRSQRGDCCFEIDPAKLPNGDRLEQEAEWERGLQGPARLGEWLKRTGAKPFDFDRDLDDAALAAVPLKPLHEIRGGCFFRGLALLDLAEAMLKRQFGDKAVAVRVNAAGQGDYFQVHVDTLQAAPDRVKAFIERAFYRRFGLCPRPLFVEPHPGGGAIGVRLDRFDQLPTLIETLSSGGLGGSDPCR